MRLATMLARTTLYMPHFLFSPHIGEYNKTSHFYNTLKEEFLEVLGFDWKLGTFNKDFKHYCSLLYVVHCSKSNQGNWRNPFCIHIPINTFIQKP